MTLFEAKEQLKDLRKNQESFLDSKDPDEDNPFLKDIQAIDTILEAVAGMQDLLKEIKPILRWAFFANYEHTNKANELYERASDYVGRLE